MLTVKTSQRNDFRDVNVRRLSGDLSDLQSYVNQAIAKLDKLLFNERYDITIGDIKNDPEFRSILEYIFGTQYLNE